MGWQMRQIAETTDSRNIAKWRETVSTRGREGGRGMGTLNKEGENENKMLSTDHIDENDLLKGGKIKRANRDSTKGT